MALHSEHLHCIQTMSVCQRVIGKAKLELKCQKFSSVSSPRLPPCPEGPQEVVQQHGFPIPQEPGSFEDQQKRLLQVAQHHLVYCTYVQGVPEPLQLHV